MYKYTIYVYQWELNKYFTTPEKKEPHLKHCADVKVNYSDAKQRTTRFAFINEESNKLHLAK